ncbi:Lsr2 family protein [Streptomyces sp. BHT-5-2]|uniref:Lsr2 family DNA-binding protein n=1 Tax=Streptomyces TaxID=1883 RepID=UPI001C8DD463|nr:histone-like nucleoid-structuring protein Lsr2 [Streptomyces sp. BHT-5-2]QZL02305.1 Lsr2 family protein [Streptomyces sp. BHT-5-2]
MRKTVLMPVEKVLCDAHMARDGSEVEATDALTLGRHSWDLCLEHNVTFGRYLCDALGAPSEGEGKATEPEPVSVPVAEPAPAHAAEPSPVVTECDERDVGGEASEPESVRSVMIAGEVPGYDWDTAREAVRSLGYEVVGRADESTALLIVGEGGDRNGTKLRDARERGIPCMDVRVPGRFKSAVCAGELVGGDSLPEPAKVGPKVMSERERNKAVRTWARENGYVVPSKGRIPMHVRHAYELAHRDASEEKAVAA